MELFVFTFITLIFFGVIKIANLTTLELLMLNYNKIKKSVLIKKAFKIMIYFQELPLIFINSV